MCSGRDDILPSFLTATLPPLYSCRLVSALPTVTFYCPNAIPFRNDCLSFFCSAQLFTCHFIKSAWKLHSLLFHIPSLRQPLSFLFSFLTVPSEALTAICLSISSVSFIQVRNSIKSIKENIKHVRIRVRWSAHLKDFYVTITGKWVSSKLLSNHWSINSFLKRINCTTY